MQAAAHTISRFSDRRITLLYRLSRPWHNPRHFTGKIQMYLADLHHKWNPPYSKAQPGTTIFTTVCSVPWRKCFTKSDGPGKWGLRRHSSGEYTYTAASAPVRLSSPGARSRLWLLTCRRPLRLHRIAAHELIKPALLPARRLLLVNQRKVVLVEFLKPLVPRNFL